MSSNRFILTLRCPDARGIIHAISGALLELEGNVFEQAQYTNESTGVFVMRTRFEANTTDVEVVRARLEEATAHFSPTITLRTESDHRESSSWCRSTTTASSTFSTDSPTMGEIAMDVPVIVSNHEAWRVIAEQYDIPFMYVPVESGVDGSKAVVESRLRMGDHRGVRIDAVVPRSLHADPSAMTCAEISKGG